MSDFSYDTSVQQILNTQRALALRDVLFLNTLQVKDYENTINNWKLNGKKPPVPVPPGSYTVEDVLNPVHPGLKIPEIRFHAELPACTIFVDQIPPAQLLTAIVSELIEGYNPPRYQSLDTLPIGTQGYAPDGKLVTKVGVLTPFGRSVWYQ